MTINRLMYIVNVKIGNLHTNGIMSDKLYAYSRDTKISQIVPVAYFNCALYFHSFNAC